MIVFPIFHKKKTFKQLSWYLIAIGWVVPISWDLGFIIPTSKVVGGRCHFQEVWPSLFLAMLNYWVALAMSYFIPFLIFIFCYTHMLFVIRKQQKRVVNITNQATHLSSAKINITITILLICLAYILLWTPSVALTAVFLNGYIQLSPNNPLSLGFDILVFCNCVINPFIYVFRIKGLQTKVASLLCCKGQVTGQGPSDVSPQQA